MQKLLVIFALLFANQAFTQTENCTSACPSIGKKADYCYCIPELNGKSVQFADKDSKMYFANSAKAKPLAITIPKDASVSSMISMMKSVKFKFKPEDVLLIQAAIPKWEIARKNIGYMVTASGLAYKVTKEGTGKLPEKGKKVKVNYKGYLEDGTVFDSSFERKQPIEFTLGVGQVIKGWDEGIMIFKVGGSGTLKIPSELGYGKTGAGQLIPPNATLYFDIEVVNAD